MWDKIIALLGGKFLEEVRGIVNDTITTQEEKMQKINELYALQVKDLESARNRETQLRNTIGVWVQNVAAVFVIVAFVLVLLVVIYRPQEIPNKTLADIMLGSLGTIVVQIFQYWFGSSKHIELK
jgi:hypothetical protein